MQEEQLDELQVTKAGYRGPHQALKVKHEREKRQMQIRNIAMQQNHAQQRALQKALQVRKQALTNSVGM